MVYSNFYWEDRLPDYDTDTRNWSQEENEMLRLVGKILNIFSKKSLIDKLDQNNKYIILAKAINWPLIELSLSVYYSKKNGAKALPIRLMVGLQILKYFDNLSDQQVCERWQTDHYYQVFTGNHFVEDIMPCDPSMMSVFRKRIGKEGMESIFKLSIEVFGVKNRQLLERNLIIDSTVQEKYTAFPTDIKLSIDVIHKIWKICDSNSIKLRSKHKKEVNKLRKQAAFNKTNRKNEVKTSVLNKLRDLGLKLLKEMTKKLPDDIKSTEEFIKTHDNYFKVLTQDKNDKNKIYSIFEPQIYCIAKGKQNKKYEFGTKVGIIMDRSGIIFGIKSFDSNIHDSKTITDLLFEVRKNSMLKPKFLIGDAGYRGRKYFGETILVTPINNLDKLTPQNKSQHIKMMNDRSSIEQTISHMKNDSRLGRNELRGICGDQINPLLSAAAHNLKLYVLSQQKKVKNKLKVSSTLGKLENRIEYKLVA
jgi:IS5 family transposase